METILIATDFSKPAENAAIYGLTLAKELKADCKLFHADSDVSGKPSSNIKLAKLADKLVKKNVPCPAGTFIPLVRFTALAGPLADVAGVLSEEKSMALIVLGTSGTGGQKSGFSGSGSREMISCSKLPLLLVPALAQNQMPKKIALVTSLNEEEIPLLYSLSTLARDLRAEIIIVHIDAVGGNLESHQNQLHQFLEKTREEIHFTAFSYRNIESKKIASGLNRFVADALIGMLVMSHSRYEQLESLLRAENSYVIEMVHHLHMPLLIYPDHTSVSGYPIY